jgi:hypothetical protein
MKPHFWGFLFVLNQSVGAFTSNPVLKFYRLKKIEEAAPTLIVEH